jgi:hypothetical protein
MEASSSVNGASPLSQIALNPSLTIELQQYKPVFPVLLKGMIEHPPFG